MIFKVGDEVEFDFEDATGGMYGYTNLVHGCAIVESVDYKTYTVTLHNFQDGQYEGYEGMEIPMKHITWNFEFLDRIVIPLENL